TRHYQINVVPASGLSFRAALSHKDRLDHPGGLQQQDGDNHRRDRNCDEIGVGLSPHSEESDDHCVQQHACNIPEGCGCYGGERMTAHLRACLETHAHFVTMKYLS